jgi:hypothetical protein
MAMGAERKSVVALVTRGAMVQAGLGAIFRDPGAADLRTICEGAASRSHKCGCYGDGDCDADDGGVCGGIASGAACGVDRSDAGSEDRVKTAEISGERTRDDADTGCSVCGAAIAEDAGDFLQRHANKSMDRAKK